MSVWKRIQRVGKQAGKFQFVVSFHELTLECTKGTWKPSKLSITISRGRNRRYSSQAHDWEPTIVNPFRGIVTWTSPECLEFVTTLFKEARADEFEDKDWTLTVEEIEPLGRRRPLAAISVNLKYFVDNLGAKQQHATVKLKPTSRKVLAATLNLTFGSTLLREGKATDEDMQSLASLMSLQQPHLNDIGNLADFDDESPAGTLNRKQAKQNISELASSFGIFSSNSLDVDKASTNGSQHRLSFTNSINSSSSPSITDTAVVTKDANRTPSRPDSLSLDQITASPLSHQRPLNGSSRNGRPTDTIHEQTPDTKSSNTHERASGDSQLSSAVKSASAESRGTQLELLEWCQEVTRGARGVKITNFHTSWRNGLAFCAVIHHFHHELIDFSSLDGKDIKGNCKLAFDAAASLGIPKLLDPQDMLSRTVPDHLAVMTYLSTLKSHFTGQNLEIGGMDRQSKEVTYTPVTPGVDVHKKGGWKQRIFSFDKGSSSSSKPHSSSLSKESPMSEKTTSPGRRGSSPKDKPLSPSKKSLPPALKKSPSPKSSHSASGDRDESLMTRLQLVDPFHDSDEEETAPPRTPSAISPVGGGTPTREEELRLRARELIEQARSQSSSVTTSPTTDSRGAEESARQKELRERAKKMIDSVKKISPGSPVSVPISSAPVPAAFRAKSPSVSIQFYQFKKLDGPSALSSPLSMSNSDGSIKRAESLRGEKFSLHKDGTRTTDVASAPVVAATAKQPETLVKPTSPNRESQISTKSSESNRTDVTKSSSTSEENGYHFKETLDDIADIHEERSRLKREQELLDDHANQVESRLRRAMEPDAVENEEEILKEWFALVNKRNAIIRRLDQLNNFEKENDLETRHEKLKEELRTLNSLEDWQRTEAHRRREQMLMMELMEIVKQRDELVKNLDDQEKAIEEDNVVAQTVMRQTSKLTSKDQKECVIQ
ncbi:EH domain-binding protein 1 [Hypsibius exemplaris]|uniref:EH domain-binding protein 1 n=1 Tax=Hypsibius exemplaris TaxID=2072580 RepID=A0A1W0WCR2_HYPEX|nr:EH domain-binding protein 1 [Hypsibius exemplaris]